MTAPPAIPRYRKLKMTGHWLHTVAVLTLILTGALTLFPVQITEGNTIRFIHRVAVIVAAGTMVSYLLFNLKESWHYALDSFRRKTPASERLTTVAYRYLGGNRTQRPTQDLIDAGHRVWQAVMFSTGPLFLITGLTMWFFKESLPAGVYIWCLFVHDAAFVALVVSLPLHMVAKAAKPVVTGPDCTECNVCVEGCQSQAIVLREGQPAVNTGACVYCASCIESCPTAVFGIEYTGIKYF